MEARSHAPASMGERESGCSSFISPAAEIPPGLSHPDIQEETLDGKQTLCTAWSWAGQWASCPPPGSLLPSGMCQKGPLVTSVQQWGSGKWPSARLGAPALLFLTEQQQCLSFLFLLSECWTKGNQINLHKPSASRQGSPRETKKATQHIPVQCWDGWFRRELGKRGSDCTDASAAKKMQLGVKGTGFTEKSSWEKQGENKRQQHFYFQKSQDLLKEKKWESSFQRFSSI